MGAGPFRKAAMTLEEFLEEVRENTQHVGDDRVEDSFLCRAGNRAAKKIRALLARDVPTLYLAKSADIVLATGEDIAMVDTEYNPGNLYKLERYYAESEEWLPVLRAAESGHNRSAVLGINFRIENRCILLGPDGYDTAGTYRVKFHPTPADLSLSDTSQSFEVPDELDDCLVFFACGKVALGDRDGHELKAKWDKDARDEYAAVLPTISDRYGVHDDHNGLLLLRWGAGGY